MQLTPTYFLGKWKICFLSLTAWLILLYNSYDYLFQKKTVILMIVSLQDYGHKVIKENILRFSRVLLIPLANYYLFSIHIWNQNIQCDGMETKIHIVQYFVEHNHVCWFTLSPHCYFLQATENTCRRHHHDFFLQKE